MTKVRDGLYGLIVADALGVPAESRAREDLRSNPITGMVGGGMHGQPAGYWSDDSSMTLCLADSIGKVGYYHTHDIMARFDDWVHNGSQRIMPCTLCITNRTSNSVVPTDCLRIKYCKALLRHPIP